MSEGSGSRDGARRPGRRRACGHRGRLGRRAVTAPDGQLVPASLQQVDHQDPPEQRLPDPGDQLDRLHGHHRAGLGAQRPDHARLGARRHTSGRGRLGEHVPQLHPSSLGGGVPEHGHLGGEAEDRAPHQGQAGGDAAVVDQVAGREVVAAVDHQVVVPDDAGRIGRGQAQLVGAHRDRGILRAQRGGRGVHLGPPDGRGGVDHLAVQVRRLDPVGVDDPDGAHPGGGQVLQHRGSEPAGADHQHPGGGQPALAGHPEFGQDHLPRVALQVVGVERTGRRQQRRQGHEPRTQYQAMAVGSTPSTSAGCSTGRRFSLSSAMVPARPSTPLITQSPTTES